MSFIKKQSAGTWAALITLILAAVSLIIYNANLSGEGYFKNANVSTATQYVLIGMGLLVITIIASQFALNGIADRVLRIVTDAMRIVFPALMIAAALTIVSARVQGFAFIYFSNEEVLQEVQTVENISSAHGAIANIVALAVTAVVGMIAAFFSTKKKQA